MMMICFFRQFDVVAVWFKNATAKKYNLEVNLSSKRKKRSTYTINHIYVDFDDMKNNDKDGKFSFHHLRFAQLF